MNLLTHLKPLDLLIYDCELRKMEPRRKETVDTSTVRIVCAVLAIVLIGIIVLRRKKSAEE
jgi:hypothetical protein